MKRLLIVLTVLLVTWPMAFGERKTTVRVSGDTVVYTDHPADSATLDSLNIDDDGDNSFGVNPGKDLFDSDAAKGFVAATIISTVVVFAAIVLIVGMAFYFRYKSRRERYRLIEKAIEAGQPIPQELNKKEKEIYDSSKGVKNICVGLGLFIFLWAITHSFGVGAVGLLVMFVGIGQWINGKNHDNKNEE